MNCIGLGRHVSLYTIPTHFAAFLYPAYPNKPINHLCASASLRLCVKTGKSI